LATALNKATATSAPRHPRKLVRAVSDQVA
jgi:hypothetical protein